MTVLTLAADVVRDDVPARRAIKTGQAMICWAAAAIITAVLAVVLVEPMEVTSAPPPAASVVSH